MRILGRLLLGIDQVTSWAAGLALVTITLVLFFNSMARYFANVAFVGGEELARYLMVWLTFLGGYLLVRVQRHITVDLFATWLSHRAGRALDVVIGIVGAGLMGYVAWLGWELAAFIFNTNQMMSSLPIRRGWIYLSVPVGCGLMAVAYVFQVLVRLFGGDLPAPERYGLVADVPPAAERDDAGREEQ